MHAIIAPSSSSVNEYTNNTKIMNPNIEANVINHPGCFHTLFLGLTILGVLIYFLFKKNNNV